MNSGGILNTFRGESNGPRKALGSNLASKIKKNRRSGND
jgi:hypothetical protein